MNIILLGPPGAGKGTQSKMIEKEYNIPHVSVGDILRKAMQEGTELGKEAAKYVNDGKLLPDDLTIKLVDELVNSDELKNGFILDGFPRTIAQAEALDKITGIDVALDVESRDETIVDRISSRIVCPQCHHIYGKAKPPKEEGICDKCGHELKMRDDQTPEVIQHRLEVYHRDTKPLTDYYKKKGILKTINGEQPIKEVFEDVRKALSA